jgi:hypothetical protein
MKLLSLRKAAVAAAVGTLGTVGGIGFANAAHAANSDGSPSLKAVLVNAGDTGVQGGNWAIYGSGYTPGNGHVNVWLIDQTTNTLLWYTPSAYVQPNGSFEVSGPMQYSPGGGVAGGPMWYPAVSIPCGHVVIARAKDGSYSSAGRWDTGPGPYPGRAEINISPPCPVIN